ncbi:hypothetical protein M9H77_07790 [Catharanthus roseus]|uniref:Uncharacterized protein n=1 Tax=Catharanthus roseus TaxID=4058 RepID=A0ACC0BVZ3_CATRO|nr:hypothetical protein M9H77_07790 [Catharanthus roseus]
MEVLKYLWQHVERVRMERKNNNSNNNNNNVTDVCLGSVEKKKNKNEMNGKKKLMTGNSESAAAEGSSTSSDFGIRGIKMCVRWTPDLHAKFLDAVNQLGEGKCYPSDILEKMKVPGLTRLQVASHLQKCRNRMLQDEQLLKRAHPSLPPKSTDDELSKKKVARRKYGSMPHPNIMIRSNSNFPQQQGNLINPSSSSSSSNGDRKLVEYMFI